MSEQIERLLSKAEPFLSKAMSKNGKLQRASLKVLFVHEQDNALPTNGRFLFYELEHDGIVRKSKPGESRRLKGLPGGSQDLTDGLMFIRERGLAPWHWIVDETRTLTVWEHAVSVAEYVKARVDEARINPWDLEEPPLILVESRSLGGVLRSLAGSYLCPIAATNGQAGGFLRTEVLPLLRDDDRRRVLYLGDLDEQGAQIEANTRDVLERELDAVLHWERLALTEEQAEGLEPIWKRDERYRPAREGWAWETEALGQQTVMSLVRAALDSLLPEPLADVLERERAQRKVVKTALASLGGEEE